MIRHDRYHLKQLSINSNCDNNQDSICQGSPVSVSTPQSLLSSPNKSPCAIEKVILIII